MYILAVFEGQRLYFDIIHQNLKKKTFTCCFSTLTAISFRNNKFSHKYIIVRISLGMSVYVHSIC